MAKPIYSKFVQTSAGAADPSASFTVVNEETGLDVDIYSDRAGTTVITPPYFADSSGLIRFYYDEGITIRIAVTGASGSFTDRYQEGRVFGGEPGNSPRILDFQVASISQLPPATGSGRKVSVTGYHDGTTVGGGHMVDAGLGRHNGVTLFDPNRKAEIGTSAYYVDSGVDANCWERVGVDSILMSSSGAKTGTDAATLTLNSAVYQACVNLAVSTGMEVDVDDWYEYDTTVTAPASTAIKINGNGHWLGTPNSVVGGRLTFVGTGYGLEAHTVTLDGLVYDGKPDLVTGVYTAGRSGIKTSGNFHSYNSSLLGFDIVWERTGGTGYYHKIFGGSWQWFNLAVKGKDLYNTTFNGVSIYEFNSFATWSGGAGPVSFMSCSIEAFTSTAFVRESGATSNLFVFDDCYIENYPTTPVRAGLAGTTYDDAIFFSITDNHLRIINSTIYMQGIKRLVSASSVKSLHMEGNVYREVDSPLGTAPDAVVSLGGTLDGSYYFNDVYDQASATVDYIFGVTIGQLPQDTSASFEGYYKDPLSKRFKTMLRNYSLTIGAGYKAPSAQYNPISYGYTSSGDVYLTGAVSADVGTTELVGTLPAGFRPSKTQVFRVASVTSGIEFTARVLATGDVRIEAAGITAQDIDFGSQTLIQ